MNVLALPEPVPDDFGDAIGLFSIKAEASLSNARVNEPLTLLVTLSGQGNLQTLSDPIWPEMEGWRSFSDQTTSDVEFDNERIVGRKIYKCLLVPSEAGDFVIPAITYTYFDPDDEEYRSVSTEPLPVSVALADEETPVPGSVSAMRSEIERQASDIRHIKPLTNPLRLSGQLMTNSWFYWFMWLIPIFLIVANFAFLRRQNYRVQNADLIRNMRAAANARKLIAQAQKREDDIYQVMGQVLNTYLSQKLGQPVVGLTQSALLALLQNQQIDETLISRVQNVLLESDMGRFSPNAQSLDRKKHLFDDLEQLIIALEKAFNE